MHNRLRRIARYLILAARKDDYLKRLEKSRPDLDAERTVQELLKLNNPKKEKMALHWICKGTLELPDNQYRLDGVFNLIDRFRLDFQRYDSPEEVIKEKDRRIQRHVQDQEFDPRKEKAFSNPYNAGAGIVVYEVEDSREGQLATRRAIDVSWGVKANPWCLVARSSSNFPDCYDYDWILASPEELREIDLEELEESWAQWKSYDAYPKRIAFLNGELLAFCASKKYELSWWDHQNRVTDVIPVFGARDDQEFIKRYIETAFDEEEATLDPFADPEILLKFSRSEIKNTRKNVAKHPNSPVEALEILMGDEDDEIVEIVASHQSASKEILERLSRHKKEEVRMKVAFNENTAEETLEHLSGDSSESVRAVVAVNGATSSEVLDRLSEDESFGVRFNVAYNPNAPNSAIERLASDESSRIRNNVAGRRVLPDSVILALAGDDSASVRRSIASNERIHSLGNLMEDLSEDEDYLVRATLVDNESVSRGILEKLPEDKSWFVRNRVALNPSTPVEVLEILAEDRNSRVASAAENNLRSRE